MQNPPYPFLPVTHEGKEMFLARPSWLSYWKKILLTIPLFIIAYFSRTQYLEVTAIALLFVVMTCAPKLPPFSGRVFNGYGDSYEEVTVH